MPLPTSIVGTTTAPLLTTVDVRATMAFAAGIGDLNPAYLDTERSAGVVAHPLHPVSVEWPAVLAAGRQIPGLLTRSEARASVHLTHDLVIHRPVVPGDELVTTATFTSVARHRGGALAILRLATEDTSGAPVCTTEFGSLYRGSDVVADAGEPEPALPTSVEPPARHDVVVRRELTANAAHVYTECARIWNPIHTDPAAARAAGLPGIVLHGTATLAIAVRAVVDHAADGDPSLVRRVRARFGALVLLPSSVDICVGPPVRVSSSGSAREVAFEVRTGEGDRAIRDASVTLGPPSR